MTYNLHRDATTGKIVFEADPVFSILKSFVESELQEDIAFIDLLRLKLKAPTNLPSEITGNSHTILIDKTSFQIENLYDDQEPLSGDNKDLLDLLETLKSLIAQ